MVIANDFALEFNFSVDLLFAKRTILFAVEIFALFFLFYLVKSQKKLGKNPKTVMEATEKDKDIYTGLEQAHFQTDK